MSRRAGSKGGGELERLVEAWLLSCGWKVHRAAAAGVARRGGRVFTRSHDLFGCFDFLACAPDGATWQTWALQATAPANRSPRRTKIDAAGPWPASWRVSIVHHLSARVGRETLHWLLVEDRAPDGTWGEPARVQVDVRALQALRSARRSARRAEQEPAP